MFGDYYIRKIGYVASLETLFLIIYIICVTAYNIFIILNYFINSTRNEYKNKFQNI